MHRRRLPRAALLPLLGLLALTVGTSCTAINFLRIQTWFDTYDPEARLSNPVRNDIELSVMWLGHASVLIQIGDKVILTDPLLTDTVGQISKRVVEEGIDDDDMPPLDVVLISHLHMDHLSLGSLYEIDDRIGHLLVPDGGLVYIPNVLDFTASELATWRTWECDGLRITAVPVSHTGWRYWVDQWMTHSATAYIIEYRGLVVWFGGDTSYDRPHFVTTAHRFPEIHLAIVPIGPIKPVDVMRPHHADPAQAVQIFKDLQAHHMLPIHYGNDADNLDDPSDPIDSLRSLMLRGEVDPRRVTVLLEGEQVIYTSPAAGRLFTADHITRSEIFAAYHGAIIPTVGGIVEATENN